MGFGRRQLVLIISQHMLTVICHIDPPGESGRRVEEGERKGERGRERERERERQKREERIGYTIDIYTTYTVHLLLYLHAA